MADFEKVFVDIDTQKDFVEPDGHLHVPGAEHLPPLYARLFAYARQNGIPIISSQDNHPPDDEEFETFGSHCVQGTAGQQRIAQTLAAGRLEIDPQDTLDVSPVDLMGKYEQLIFNKASLEVFDNPHFAALVEQVDVGEYIVFGLTTEYCVLQACRGLRKRGKKVKVVRDAIRAVSRETGEPAVREMTQLGAEWIDSADLLGATA